MIKISIIIPVFNKWELTRNCLKSLAASTNPADVEVVLVDNASSDATAQGAPFLGRQLFGDSFIYQRNEINRNFAGASNQGAKLARGQYLVFLNNDTIAQPDWLEPLLEDFTAFPDIAATGPLLLYEQTRPFGHTVQHLGVRVNPLKKFAHLYSGIPADSKLAKKRRFFQVITAACMCMPKNLFLDIGAFDEGFINGFEDVDLCARLVSAGWRNTVNPASKILHLESRTPGRHACEDQNSKRLSEGNLKYLKSDMVELFEADGLQCVLNAWLDWQAKMPDKDLARLDLAINAGFDELQSILPDNPYWENGWKILAGLHPEAEVRFAIRMEAFCLFKNLEFLLDNCEDALKNGNLKIARQNLANVAPYMISKENYLKSALYMQDYFLKENNQPMALLFENWIKGYENFAENIYSPAAARVAKLEAVCKSR